MSLYAVDTFPVVIAYFLFVKDHKQPVVFRVTT